MLALVFFPSVATDLFFLLFFSLFAADGAGVRRYVELWKVSATAAGAIDRGNVFLTVFTTAVEMRR